MSDALLVALLNFLGNVIIAAMYAYGRWQSRREHLETQTKIETEIKPAVIEIKKAVVENGTKSEASK